MTKTQRVAWITLPRSLEPIQPREGEPSVGQARWSLRATVLALPVLTRDADQTLADFPVFASWIDNRPTQFVLAVNGSEFAQCQPDTTAPHAAYSPDPAVWSALLPATTRVRRAEIQDTTQLEHLGFSLAEIETIPQVLSDLVAVHDVEPPTSTQLQVIPAISDLIAARASDAVDLRRLTSGVDLSSIDPSQWARVLDPAASPGRRLADTVLDAQDFYAVSHAATLPPVEAPDFDFHDLLSMFDKHAPLLRILGLATDVRASLVLEGVEDRAHTDIEIAPAEWSPDPDDLVSVPFTSVCAVDRRAGDFYAVRSPDRSVPTEADRGVFLLGDPDRFHLTALDPDAAVQRAGSLASSVAGSAPDTRTALPALTTGGITVARRARPDVAAHAAVRRRQLHEAILDADGIPSVVDDFPSPSDDIRLFEEDLRRGFRLDLRYVMPDDARSPWYSLQARTGRYLVAGVTDPIDVPVDEAVLTGQATLAKDDDGQTIGVRVHEALATYNGWSLAVPRPGGWIDEENQAVVASEDRPAPFALADDETIGYRFTPPPGSLPPLRIGSDYEVRARTVDLAGNSRSVDDTARDDDPLVVGRLAYARYEPVNPPDVLLAAPRKAGESPDVVVIAGDGNGIEGTAPAARHLAPPGVDVTRAEQSGAFDGAAGLDPDAYDRIALLDAGGLAGDDAPGGRPAHPDAVVERTDADGRALSYWYRPTGNRDRVDVNWITDPAGRGICVRAIDAEAGEVGLIQVSGANGPWTDVGAKRLDIVPAPLPGGDVLAATHPKVHLDLAERGFQIALEEGSVVEILTSSAFVFHEEYERFALYKLLRARGELAPETRNRINAGVHPQFTPPRRLTLVHATRQPVLAPVAVGAPTLTPRDPGTTAQSVTWEAQVHGPSTASVELLATLVDVVDRGPGSGPLQTITTDDIVDSFIVDHPVDLTTRGRSVSIATRHLLPTTRSYRVGYGLRATSAHVEYFRQRLEGVDLSDPSVSEVLLDEEGHNVGVIPSTVRVTDPEEPGAPLRRRTAADGPDEADFEVDEEAGTITPLRPLGSGLTVSYVVPPIIRDAPPAEPDLTVLAARRPAPPSVDFVVPAFSWSEIRPSRPQFESTRRGRRLRVYLDRPQYSSGAGELVGVAVQRDPEPPDASTPWFIGDPDPSLITRMAADPLFHTGRPGVADPFSGDVLSAIDTVPQIVLPGGAPGPETAVALALHDQHLDHEETDRYWVDIEFDTGDSYSPFVRLALCNYQPNAVPGQRVSSVVLADFCQLTPDRTASVTRTASDTVSVALSGPGYDSAGVMLGYVARPAVVAHVEVRDRRIADARVAWSPIDPDSAPISLHRSPETLGVWIGEIEVPPGYGDSDLRIVLREYEQFATDAHVDAVVDLGGPLDQQIATQSVVDGGSFLYHEARDRTLISKGTVEEGRRLVHQDILPIPPQYFPAP